MAQDATARTIFTVIHLNFIIGIIYAFFHYAINPRRTKMFARRLWAYETWIIMSFYIIFCIIRIFEERLINETGSTRNVPLAKRYLLTLFINLILLVFPWGIFLLVAPQELLNFLSLGSWYWRILGGMSLLGAMLYYIPFKWPGLKISYYILIFGAIDNFLAGLIVLILFILDRVPLSAFGCMFLLFYFSLFFLESILHYKPLVAQLQKIDY